MKKVGIVSCYFKDNYGSMLQAYATKKFLDNNEIENETIRIDSNKDFKKGKRKYYLSQVFNYSFIKSKLGMIKLKVDKKINKELRKNISIRTKKYKEFRKEINYSINCVDYKGLEQLAKIKYCDVVVGSDQLWLPVNVVADYYTLNWVPENINKISYSTSFGVSTIPDKYENIYKKFLNRINNLSVREETGVSIIEKISNRKAKLVSDPTILLDKADWQKIGVKDRIYKEKYILCYFLGNNIAHRKFAERLREKTGFKIVSLNHADEYVKYSDKFCDYAPFDVGPREWINLIENAEYVCTDSFHGTVFSILFNKIFFDFRRHNSKNKNNTNSRIDSLLDVAGIPKERILTGTENVDDVLEYKIDYEKVNKNIAKFRKESQEWFLNALSYEKEEKKYIEITEKDMCSGCTACKSICPKQAIEMISDEEGFLYPKVNKDKCIECGLCKKTCPILNKQEFNGYEQKAFLFQNKEEDIRKESTSGGFYTALGKYIINKNGLVYGASFNKNFVVEHTCAKNDAELKKFRKSKYVQSNLNDVFIEIRKHLNNGKLVCFSGTPCQVAGLKSFLKKDYDNLVTVDLMCRAVPSPLLFEKYKKYILKEQKADKILDIVFRDKSKWGYKYSMMTVKTDNGIHSQGVETDPYLRAFFSGLSVRPSCYNCKFKTQKRVSDITIWDCFNVADIDKSFDDDKGTTRILVHSEKGLEFLYNLENCKISEINVDVAVNKFREMLESVNYNSNREKLFKKINEENVIEEEFPITLKINIEGSLRRFLSITGLYNIVKKMAKKVLKK